MAHEAEHANGADSRARARIEAALDERRRSFLRMVSHELRTPLNSILGFSEILMSELYGPLGAPQYKEYAEIIHGSGQKLLKLVNQVLEIARLEGNTIEFDAGPESLEAALDDVLLGLKGELAARGVRVAIAQRGNLPAVIADGRGLRSVLTQLIHNAIVFSPEGGAVTVEATRKGGHVDIVIQDETPHRIHRGMTENATGIGFERVGENFPALAQTLCKRRPVDARPEHRHEPPFALDRGRWTRETFLGQPRGEQSV